MLSCRLDEGAELRPLEPWQAAEFAAHADRDRAHFEPWLQWTQLVTDEESARAFLQRYADRQAADDGRIYGIWSHGRLVGGTLFRIFSPADGLCEIGVWLSPEAQGRGLITRAARLMIDWAVGERGMHRVEWRNAVENERSKAVAKRLGMTLDGVLREAFPYLGRRFDIEVWSLLASEWRSGDAPPRA
ncbi:RimJ/RimL family protein N-acetyltransferase [Saccharopolyspora erythraea NRRL 2338]|uniref:Acetyltransferase n=2 Tax=Saccharopolyspora erythraea TaxID=1836 RepID=A4FKK5_SACEN|nr:GNAT family protein [Saccharopolyspora erythraea]EQD82925.1 N-acetyltransferase GCN5 [Saccharopolyspora erythraea D]PFG98218.1 RimJ/RimL family protein N-acetyltransferase [Saccharopolyspora erythraea NRRL 2338]QRK88316.1 GNAT family N-acetyltransferase [Saccharopolyspora erythraea]CAM04580.1 acetyltransferase [Saccharopolyspora erythraea NRRL 2338]